MALLVFVAALSLLVPSTTAGAIKDTAPSIILHVTAPLDVHDVNGYMVNTTIVNAGAHPISLLRHPGFFEQLSDTFAIIDSDSNVAPYIGAQIHFSPELAVQGTPDEALLALAPGESFLVTHDLGSAYDLSNLKSGQAQMKLRSTGSTFYTVDTQTRAVTTTQATVVHVQPTVEVAHGAALATNRTGHTSAQVPVPMAGCTGVQTILIDTVIPFAEEYVAAANTYLQLEGANSTFYQKWFGPDIDTYVNTVVTGFQKIATNDFASYTFNCGGSAPLCQPGINAYVYPSQFGIVYLCDHWFASETIGYNSQAAILVHEASHFGQNAATSDYAYGTNACLELALGAPDKATRNADNYQYFSVDAGGVHL